MISTFFYTVSHHRTTYK